MDNPIEQKAKETHKQLRLSGKYDRILQLTPDNEATFVLGYLEGCADTLNYCQSELDIIQSKISKPLSSEEDLPLLFNEGLKPETITPQ